MKFTVVQGDIAEETVDALVNAAGTSLKMGSGLRAPSAAARDLK